MHSFYWVVNPFISALSDGRGGLGGVGNPICIPFSVQLRRDQHAHKEMSGDVKRISGWRWARGDLRRNDLQEVLVIVYLVHNHLFRCSLGWKYDA